MYEYDIINNWIHNFKFNGLISDNDVNKYANDMELLFNNNEIFYIVLNVIEIKNFDFSFFNKFDKIFEDEDKVKKNFKGSAILTNNKSILKFILSIKKPLMPTKVFDNYNDGITYLTHLKESL